MTGKTFLCKGVGVLLLALLLPLTGFAFGIGVEISFYTLDLSASLAKVSPAVEDSLHRLGIPLMDIATTIVDLEAALAQIEANLPVTSLPLPLLGGSIELPFPFLVIDRLRLSGGILSDGLLGGAAGLFGTEIPSLLIDETIVIDRVEGTIRAAPSFSTLMLATEFIKQVDLLIMGFDLGVGGSLIQGRIDPQVEINLPGLQTEADAALAALHLDGISWSTFAFHASFGAEIGPPFLRMFARGRLLLPISQTPGWWGIRIGSISGSVGLAVRF
ncbi:hypothetical protein LR032_02715 [Candidatus Bipolaricaulota bacterium]|nr:hypothetical protein [Candidatus Bipolaricaulota bacterium]